MTANQCPHLDKAKLAEDRLSMGSKMYAQEYEATFNNVIDSVFDEDDIEAAMSFGVKPLFAARQQQGAR